MRNFLLAALLCFIICTPAYAEIIINDNFVDTSQVDLQKTTAYVDTANHWIQLPLQSLSSAIDVLKDGYGYVVASKDGVNLYEYDDFSGTVVLNSLFSCAWATDATGVSLRQDNLNMWVITSDSVAYYKFTGAGMSNDPALKTTGLVDVLSVAAFNNTNAALVLQKEDGKAKITRYDSGATLDPVMVFQTEITDPVAISMINDIPDFRLFTKTAAHYFMYDDATGNYIEDTARKIINLTDIVSANSDEAGTAILTKTDLGYYMDNDIGGSTRVSAYSPGAITKPISVSLKAGTYEQVFLNEDGEIQWWSYDDHANIMRRDSSMELSGLLLNIGFAHPREYYSKKVETASEYDAAYLTVTEDKPEGTSIEYYISSDGGNTFVPIAPNTWTAVNRNNKFVLKGALNTNDPLQTPKILNVILQVDEDFQLQASAEPDPVERGRNLTVSAYAFRLTTGERINIDSIRAICPMDIKFAGDPALPPGQIEEEVTMDHDAITNSYSKVFLVSDLPEGNPWPDRWPNDGLYQIKVIGTRSGTIKEVIIPIEVSGHILNKLIVVTTLW